MIYDEIDTRVSGLAAGRIGEMLHKTAGGRQVICITHTAQIARRQIRIFLLRKPCTTGAPIPKFARWICAPAKLARMISGDKVTPIALENARKCCACAMLDKRVPGRYTKYRYMQRREQVPMRHPGKESLWLVKRGRARGEYIPEQHVERRGSAMSRDGCAR